MKDTKIAVGDIVKVVNNDHYYGGEQVEEGGLYRVLSYYNADVVRMPINGARNTYYKLDGLEKVGLDLEPYRLIKTVKQDFTGYKSELAVFTGIKERVFTGIKERFEQKQFGNRNTLNGYTRLNRETKISDIQFGFEIVPKDETCYMFSAHRNYKAELIRKLSNHGYNLVQHGVITNSSIVTFYIYPFLKKAILGYSNKKGTINTVTSFIPNMHLHHHFKITNYQALTSMLSGSLVTQRNTFIDSVDAGQLSADFGEADAESFGKQEPIRFNIDMPEFGK